MKTSRPSPALVISIVALVMSTTGSALAAKVIISNSSQVKKGALKGTNLASGTINATNLSKGAIAAIVKAVPVPGPGTDATAAVSVARKAPGPSNPPFRQATVATLTGITPGSYVFLAKAVLASTVSSNDLLTQVLQNSRTALGHCALDVPGSTTDDATGPIASQFALTPVSLNMQSARTLTAAADVKLNCDAGLPWSASDVSLIAVKVGSAASS